MLLAKLVALFFFFLNLKFQASNHILRLNSSVHVSLGGNATGRFSCDAAQ